MMEQAITQSPFPDEQLLIRELTHRINNEFAHVVSMVTLAAARTGASEAQSALTAAKDRLESFIRVHRALQVPELDDRVDASAHLRELCRSISHSKLDSRNIDLVFAEHPLRLEAEQCWLLGMIIYELTNNAARHAFDEAGGEIHVAVTQTGRFVECVVSDDGTAPYFVRRGRGLKLIEDLVARLNGRFEQQLEARGSVSRVMFPA